MGTVSVMDQTLTVIVGNPAGTPGTDSIAFNSSPQSTTFDPCQGQQPPAPPSCPQTVYNGGAAWITIAGQTWGAGYDTPQNMAASFAAKVNQPGSPLTASINGDGVSVTITSVINGSATNYPISIAYQWNSQYFSSPNFSATPATPALTGGTD